MSAEIIAFPGTPVSDAKSVDCRNCINARFGVLTHCILVGEAILDEATTASDCDAYEPEED